MAIHKCQMLRNVYYDIYFLTQIIVETCSVVCLNSRSKRNCLYIVIKLDVTNNGDEPIDVAKLIINNTC